MPASVFAVVSAKRAPESARIAPMRGMWLRLRGGYAGTAMMPAQRQPKKAAMNSRPGG